ncbi:hypothetical protein [Streptomyces erythrochromogenes]|uniref:hypothetical protein n=1 Tax=Streptomyces erythrochromogenes TaxID=285574 RepID=UPI00131ACD7A|nr:hypothetical protein [Streptomyces erythrochromogenes]
MTTASASGRRLVSTVLTCLFAILAALLAPVGAAQAAPVAEDCVGVTEGRYAGTFTAAGQTHCLELPSPQGARIAALTSRGGAGLTVQVEVVDRNGTAQCTAGDLVRGECALTGTAPFRALVHADDTEATGPYGVHFVRTDVLQKECRTLPAGTFADDSGTVRLETGNGVFSHCLTIPADAHSTAELLRVRYSLPDDADLFPDYAITMIDTDGDGPSCYSHPTPGQQLRTDGLTSCSFTAGKAYTVLLEGQDVPRGHTLDRRDVTATARGCATSAATAVGAPATTGTSGQSGTLRCHRVTTAAATDRLHVDVRDTHDSTNMLIMDNAGNIACHPRTWACTPTGSTGYQVVTQAPENWSLPASYRLDAWRIATAAGPAAECKRVGSVAYGYGPLTGTLSEERTGVCAVLPSISGDRFRADITATDGGTYTPQPSLYSKAGTNLCMNTSSSYECQGSEQSLFVLALPDRTDRTAYRAELVCTTAPCGSEEVSVGTVTPTSVQSGTVATLTVQGTALGMGTTVQLTGGPAPLTATTVSVSDDARTLKATVDLRTAPAGNWNIRVSALGSSYGAGTLTVTPPAVSGLGTYKPVTPTRLMDTRSGLGVPKAKVGQGGTVTLQVAGRAGIPASGVTAVVLNVTATDPTTASHVSVYPDGTPRSSASNLNFTAGQTIPNLVVVPVANGKVSFYNNAGSVDLIADVAGYYTTDGSGSSYKQRAGCAEGEGGPGRHGDPAGRGQRRDPGVRCHGRGPERDGDRPDHGQLRVGVPRRYGADQCVEPQLHRRADDSEPGRRPRGEREGQLLQQRRFGGPDRRCGGLLHDGRLGFLVQPGVGCHGCRPERDGDRPDHGQLRVGVPGRHDPYQRVEPQLHRRADDSEPRHRPRGERKGQLLQQRGIGGPDRRCGRLLHEVAPQPPSLRRPIGPAQGPRRG